MSASLACTCAPLWKKKNKSGKHAPYCATRLADAVKTHTEPKKARVVEIVAAIDATQRTLHELRGAVLETLARAQSDRDDGFRPSLAGTGRGPTTITDEEGVPCEVHDHVVAERTVNALTDRDDRQRDAPVDLVARNAIVLTRSVELMHRYAETACAAANYLQALDPKRARQLAEEIAGSVGECANRNCQRLVPNTPTDRLRAGRCFNCWRYRKEHGIERLRELCDADSNAPHEPIRAKG